MQNYGVCLSYYVAALLRRVVSAEANLNKYFAALGMTPRNDNTPKQAWGLNDKENPRNKLRG